LRHQGAVVARHHAQERDPRPTRRLSGPGITEQEIEMNRGGGVGIVGVIVIVVVILFLVGVIRL
jgi:hypothetical protein